MPVIDQTEFSAAVLDPSRPAPAGLVDGADRPAGCRFAVYRNNVAVSLREALKTGFPAVVSLLGTENFANVAGLYLREAQPDTPLMMQYGAGFPGFLADFAPLSHLGYLADVARLDLAMRRSYHAADLDTLDPAVLQGMDAEALNETHLSLVPSTILLRSRWPALSVWRYALGHTKEKPAPRAEDVLVTRPEYDPAPHLLPPGGGAFIAALRKRAAFHEAVAAAPEDFDLGATLTLLLKTRALAALDPSAGETR